MITRKITLFFIPLIIVISSASLKPNNPSDDIEKWVILKGGSLKVTGSTNINNFSCDISDYSKPDTIILSREAQMTAGIKMQGNINLDVRSFDCHHAVMTNDLRKTLKANQFPILKINFLSLSRFPTLSAQDALKGSVEIQLAGVTNRFEVSYRLSRDKNKIIQLIGNQDINFTDFGIVPPRKVGGMIKTNNKLSVEFRLNFKVID